MNEWLLLIIATTVGSVISLIGGLYLIFGKFGTKQLQRFAVPFAAGALLAAAFFDLLPEAMGDHDHERALSFALIGFLFFFVLERSLSWFHHHHNDSEEKTHSDRNVWLIVIGDTLHNFIDSLAIGAAFLVSPATGVVATIAIAAHEIPQEIGDFGLMLSKGMRRKRVLLVNLVSALATVIGAVLIFGLGDSLPISESVLLAITAGFFIYIAASDIIPTIHAEPRRQVANLQTLVLILGVVFVAVTTTYAHSFIEHGHGDEHSEHVEDDHDHEYEHAH
jgi:zinc and cadmium transporter